MSDYSSMATLQNNSQSAGFAAALQRAKLVAAKIEGGGVKRSLEEGPEPNAKKMASLEPPFGNQQQMSTASVAAAAAAAAAASARLAANTSPQPPLPPGEQYNDYMRVPDKMVGLIIGRGGEQITRLQAETGCKIQMAPDEGQAERLCTLSGPREAIEIAKYDDYQHQKNKYNVGREGQLLNQIVTQRGRENMVGPDGGPPPPPVRMHPGGTMTEEVMLPGPKVGLVIGKNGKTIKQLQEQSGAKMVVIQDGPNTEYEKPLRITGEPAKIEIAKQLVYDLLAEKEVPFAPQRNNYDDQQDGNGPPGTANAEVLVPKVAVGVVIGRGGDMIKKIQAETGCRVQFHQERDDGPGDRRTRQEKNDEPGDRTCYLQGKPHQVDQAKQMVEDLINSVTRSLQRREAENRNPSGRGGNRNRNGEWDPEDIRVQFTVTNTKCGLIIGRGGEVIKQINSISGAHCELDRRSQGGNPDRVNRTFIIKGHPENVEHCKRIIMDKVGMEVNFIPEGENGDGNGGPGNGNGNGEPYGAAPAWGYNPHWHPANGNQPQQQQPQVPMNPSTGQPDYSMQWIEYYRSLGMMREAEAIELQVKQQSQQPSQQQQEPRPMPQQQPQQPKPAPQIQKQQPQPGGGGPGPGSGPGPSPAGTPSEAQPDYSAQWAEYYRTMGKHKEAEAIENQIKLKLQQQVREAQQQPPQQPQPPLQQQPQPLQPQGSPAGSPAMFQPQFPMYGGMPYPYPYPYPGPEHQ